MPTVTLTLVDVDPKNVPVIVIEPSPHVKLHSLPMDEPGVTLPDPSNMVSCCAVIPASPVMVTGSDVMLVSSSL